MKRIVTFCFLLFVSHLLVAQEMVKYHGIIMDSAANPVELVNVVVQDSASQEIVSFGVTNSDGQFVLKVLEGAKYVLKASFVGFEDLFLPIIGVKNSANPSQHVLRSSITELEAMEVVYEFPIVITGDTITYRSDAFTSGQERKLEDVLNALPGFEVDKDGQVKVQGKEIEKILVDGKEFFEGDTKMATQNIPASAVDKVQLLRNFNEVSPMSGLESDSERLALNIKLTEDMKNLVFGDVEAGIGLHNRYLGHFNAFFYNKKTTLNIIGDMNNIGRQAFSARDYFRFSGGLSAMSGHSGSGLSTLDDDLGFAVMENNNAQNMDNKLGAFNFNYVPSKRWNFSGFVILSSSKTDISSVNNRTYINNSNDNSETLETSEVRTSLSGLSKLKAVYSPNDKLHISYEAFAKGAELSKNATLNTNNLGDVNFIENTQSQEPLQTNHKFSSFYALSERNIFSLETNYQYKWQNPQTLILSSSRLFQNYFTSLNNEEFGLLQIRKMELHEQNAIANWYHIINKTNHLSLSVGNNFTAQTLHSRLAQFQSDTMARNELNLSLIDAFIGGDYTAKMGKLILKPGIKYHRYDFQSSQPDFENRIDQAMFLPSFSATYKILSSQTISFQYRVNNTFSDAEKLTKAIIVRTYNNLYEGNRSLTYAQSNVFNLNYYNFSMFSNLNLFGGASYQKRKRDFSDSQEYIGLERISSVINTLSPSTLSLAYVGVTKTFEKFKVDGQANISQMTTNNTINDQANTNKSVNQKYVLAAETTLFDRLTIRLSQERSYNRYRSQNLLSKFESITTKAEFDINISKSLTLSADYEYNEFSNKTGKTFSTYDFLNTTLSYQKEKSPWQVQLIATNLLNTEYIRRDSFSESLISSYTYFVQPRYALLALKYDL